MVSKVRHRDQRRDSETEKITEITLKLRLNQDRGSYKLLIRIARLEAVGELMTKQFRWPKVQIWGKIAFPRA